MPKHNAPFPFCFQGATPWWAPRSSASVCKHHWPSHIASQLPEINRPFPFSFQTSTPWWEPTPSAAITCRNASPSTYRRTVCRPFPLLFQNSTHRWAFFSPLLARAPPSGGHPFPNFLPERPTGGHSFPISFHRATLRWSTQLTGLSFRHHRHELCLVLVSREAPVLTRRAT
jgi:hypothetical protein